jgi:hypothetical protein
MNILIVLKVASLVTILLYVLVFVMYNKTKRDYNSNASHAWWAAGVMMMMLVVILILYWLSYFGIGC